MGRSCRLIMVLAAGALAGCSGPKATSAGFIESPETLTPVKGKAGRREYRASEAPLAGYDRIVVEPVVVHLKPGARAAKAKRQEVDGLAAAFTDAIVESFEPIMDVSRDGSLGEGRAAVIRTALTDVEPTTPLLNIHPGTKLSGMGLGGASMECEITDAATGQRLFALIDARLGDRLEIEPGLERWGHARRVIEGWARDLAGLADNGGAAAGTAGGSR